MKQHLLLGTLWLLGSVSAAPVAADAYRVSAEALAAAPLKSVSAQFAGDLGQVSIIELTGDYDKEVDGALNAAPRMAVAQAYYEQHPDDVDFLVVFTSFEFDAGGAAGFYVGVRNDTSGLGVPLVDHSAAFGSGGALQGYVDMLDLGSLAVDPLEPGFETTLETLTHELMHRWCCRVTFQPAGAAPSDALIGYQDAHWSYLLDSDASLMYGSDWRDNGDGTFTAVAVEKFYSPLDRYLAGFLAPEEVPDFTLLANDAIEPARLPSHGATVPASPLAVSIEDVVRAEGARQPPAAEAQKSFRAAFVFLVRPGDPIFSDDLLGIDRIREAAGTRFSVLTGGRASIEIFPGAPSGAAEGEPDPGIVPGDPGSGPVSLDDAKAWLRGRQSAEGFWQDTPATRVRDTQVALDVLTRLDPAFSGAALAGSWLAGRAEASTDYLARLAIALERAGGDGEPQRATLEARQNGDGGWGAAPGFASDALDSALVLRALAGHRDASAPSVTAAIEYLQGGAAGSGGWGGGGASRTGVTAAVLEALAAFGAAGDEAATAAVAWLASKQNPLDGGFGDSPSSAHDTAGVLGGLRAAGAGGAIDRAAAEAYLTTRQTPAGSWEGSVYATALAVDALDGGGLANLRFAAPLAAEPEAPIDGDEVAIEIAVGNAGGTPATTLDVYDGHPSGGTPIVIGLEVPPLAPGETFGLTAAWDTAGLTGEHLIYAVLDPEDLVAESLESDNLAVLAIEVVPPADAPDLAVAAGDVSFAPPAPAEIPTPLAIFANVRNRGSSDAGDVRVLVWLGQAEVGELIHDQRLSVPGRSSTLVTVAHELTTYGTTAFTVEVDPGDEIVEDDEANNRVTVSVTAQPSIDLEVRPEDVELPSPVFAGTDVTFRVTVHNRGTVDLPHNAEVRYSIAGGGTEVDLPPDSIFLAAGESRELEAVWRVSLEGDLELTVEVDGGGALETDLDNNRVVLGFVATPHDLANLLLGRDSVSFDPDPGREGKALTLTALVENTGQPAADVDVAFFDGEPAAGGELIGTARIPAIGTGESAAASVVWDRVPDAGDRFIFTVVDPGGLIEEVSEDDNLVFNELVVASLPDPALTPGSFELSPVIPRPGSTVSVTVTVTNQGEQAAEDLTVRLLDAEPSAGGQPLAPDALITIPGLATAQAVFSLEVPAGAGDLPLVAVADPEGLIEEISEANNSAAIEAAVQDGDFTVDHALFSPNGDGVLDTVRFFFRLEAPATVEVEVEDLRYREVVRTFSGAGFDGVTAGEVEWDGRDDRGRLVPDSDYRLRVAEGGAMLGAAMVSLDTDRSPLLDAVNTPFESVLNLTCLVPEPLQVTLSDDEQWIYFRLGYYALGTAYQPGLYRMRFDGSGLEALVSFTEEQQREVTDFAVSEEALKVVWRQARWNGTEVRHFVADGDGRHSREIDLHSRTMIGFGAGAQTFLVQEADQIVEVALDAVFSQRVLATGVTRVGGLSPDRRTLAVQREGALTLLDLETGVELGFDPAVTWRWPLWSPDGSRMALAGGDRVLIYGAAGLLLNEIVLPAESLPGELLPFGPWWGPEADESSGTGWLSWSSTGLDLAASVDYLVQISGEPRFEYRRYLQVDTSSGAVEHVAWSYPRRHWQGGCEFCPPPPSPDPSIPPHVVRYAGGRWLPNHRALLLTSYDYGGEGFVAEGVYLDEDAPKKVFLREHEGFTGVLSPASGRHLFFQSPLQAEDPESLCHDPYDDDLYQMRSLMNLTADLRIRRSVDAASVLLEGTAMDLHFKSYALEYAHESAPEVWHPIAPPSDRPVIDDHLRTWVPPGSGRYFVRLTVEDLAGNRRSAVRSVASAGEPEIADVYLDPEIFSPNGDGVRDQTVIHYRAFGPLHLDFDVRTGTGQIVHTLAADPPAEGSYTLAWDGRGELGFVVPDGDYVISVRGFEMLVQVDTRPFEVRIALTEPYTIDYEHGGDAITTPILRVNVRQSDDHDQADVAVERGEGFLPEWQPYPIYLRSSHSTAQGGEELRTLSGHEVLSYAAYTDSRFRVRASDQAGNQTVATTPPVGEKLMLLGAGAHRPAAGGAGFEGIGSFPHWVLVPLIEQMAGSIGIPFYENYESLLRLWLAETLIPDLAEVVVETRAPGETTWTALPAELFLLRGGSAWTPAIPDGEMELLLDFSDLRPNQRRWVRVRVRDVTGRETLSGTFIFWLRSCPAITFRGWVNDRPQAPECEAGIHEIRDSLLAELGIDPGEDIPWGNETVPGELAELRLRLRADRDPDYAFWTEVEVTQRDGVFVFVPSPSLKRCNSYFFELTGVTEPIEDPNTGIAEPVTVTEADWHSLGCIQLDADVRPELAADCGALGSGRVTVVLTPSGEDLEGLEAVLLDPSGGEEILLAVDQPVSERPYSFEMDVSGLEEGALDLEARLINAAGFVLEEEIAVAVDRTPPVPSIDVPAPGEHVCGVRFFDPVARRFRYKVDIFGTVVDELPGAEPRQLQLLTDQRREAWPGGRPLPQWQEGEVQFQRWHPTEGGFEYSSYVNEGEGWVGRFVGVEGEVTKHLSSFDNGGNKSCTESTFFVDAFEPPPSVVPDLVYFSPNGDGIQDRVTYQVAHPSVVPLSAAVFPPSPYGGCSTAGSAVRILAAGDLLVEPAAYVWDGLDDSGAVVPDGAYTTAFWVVDECGNVSPLRKLCQVVDTVPPEVEITQPEPLAPLPETMVRVRYRVEGERVRALEMGFSHDPDSWLLLDEFDRDGDTPTGGRPEPPPPVLVPSSYLWNTTGLEGDLTLRLRAVDRAGNRAETRTPLTLDVRADLILDFVADPERFSPDGDGRLEASTLSFELGIRCEAVLRILDASGLSVRLLEEDRLDAGAHVMPWDGLDDAGLPVPDGDYEAVLGAALISGLGSQEERIRLTVDATPPAVVLSRPAPDAIVRGDSDLEGSVTDQHLAYWEVFVAPEGNPTDWTRIATFDQPRVDAVLAPLPGLAEGRHLVRVAAVDRVLIESERTRLFTVDNTPPEVTLAAPEDFRHVRELVEVRGTVADENLLLWQLLVGAGEEPADWTLVVGGAGPPAQPELASWESREVFDGVYTLRLLAEDSAGNAGEARARVVVDNTPPSAVLDQPAGGAFVTGATAVTGSAADVHFLDYRLALWPPGADSSSHLFLGLEAVAGGLLFNWQSLPPDGPYILGLRVEDRAGNVAETAASIVVDTVPPAAPENLRAAVENQRDGRLDWDPSSEDDLAGYFVYRDGVRLTASPVVPVTYLDPALLEGVYTYTVSAVDLAGLESEPSAPAEIEVDLTPPAARIYRPGQDERVSGLAGVVGTAYSAADFKEYRLFAEPVGGPGSPQLLRRSPVPIQADRLGEWSTLGLAEEARFRLRLESEDLTGNVGHDAVEVTVDNLPPAAPQNLVATAAGADVHVTWDASPEPDLLGYLLYRDGHLANASGPVVGSVLPFVLTATSFDDAGLPDGTFTYVVHAVDRAENLSPPSNEDDATVERRAPRAVIVVPDDGAAFDRSLYVLATSKDFDVASVAFLYRRVGEPAWIDLEDDTDGVPFDATLDPVAAGLELGASYQLRAVATDAGGLTNPTPTWITVLYQDVVAPPAVLEVAILVDGGDVTVTWAASVADDLEGYHVYRRTGECVPIPFVSGCPPEATLTRQTLAPLAEPTYLDAGLADADYAYVVTAVDHDDNESAFSFEAPASVYTPRLLQPFTPIRETEAELVGFGPPHAQVTTVLDRPSGPVVLDPASTGGLGTFTRPLALERGLNTATVRMEDAAGNRSKPASIRVASALPPSQPQGLTAAEPRPAAGGFEIDLAWDANPESDLAGYRPARNGEAVLADREIDDFDHFDATDSASRPPQNAVDGDPATFWAPDSGAPGWIEIGWPAERLVREVTLEWLQDGSDLYAGEDFYLEALSGPAWVRLAEVSGNGLAVRRIELAEPYRTRRLRLTVETALVAGVWPLRLAEMRVTEVPILGTAPTGFTDLVGDGEYVYTLSAFNVHGFESLPSAPAEPRVAGDVVPPEPPVLAAAVDGSEVTLSWTASLDAARYDLYRDGAKVAEHADLADLTWLDAGRPNGTWVYTARAVDAAGNASEHSNEAPAVVFVEPPPAPVLLSVEPAAGEPALDLAWTIDGAPPAFYSVQRALESGGPYLEVATTAALSYRDSEVLIGVRYFYVIVAYDAAFNPGPPSNEASGVAEPDPLAPRPVLFYPTLPGTVLEVEEAMATILGRGEPDAEVTLRRGGAPVAMSASLAEPVVETVATNSFARARPSPDGRYAWLETSSGWPRGIVDFEAGAVIPVSGLSSGAGHWMPDGERVVFAQRGGSGPGLVRMIHLAGGPAETLFEYSCQAAIPSPDGASLLLVGSVTLELYDLASGVTSPLHVAASSIDASSVRWSPGGSRVAYLRGAVLEVVDLGSGAAQEIDTQALYDAPDFSPDGGRLAFSSRRGGYQELWIHDFGTGVAAAIPDTGAPSVPSAVVTFEPRFSPGGGALVYRKGGQLTIWEDGEAVAIFVSSNLEELYDWGPRGWLFFGQLTPFFFDLIPAASRLLPAGSFRFDDIALLEGDNVFTAEALGQVSEPITLIAAAPSLPDLAVELAVAPSLAVSGQTVRATATARNDGEVASPETLLSWVAVGPGGFFVELPETSVPGLEPGESRVVAVDQALAGAGHYVFTAVVDAEDAVFEASEANNRAEAPVRVVAAGGPTVGVDADREFYAAGEQVVVTAEVVNGGEPFDGTLDLALEDAGGFVVQGLGSFAVTDLGLAEIQTETVVWPTGATFAGGYRVAARLRDAAGEPVAEAADGFGILAEHQVAAAVSTDRTVYAPGALVAAEGRFDYTAGNEVLSAARAEIRILTPGGAVAAEWQQALGTLLPGAAGVVRRDWPSAGEAGVYRVEIEVRAGDRLLASAETTFELAAAGVQLAGALEPPAVDPEPGEAAAVGFVVEQLSGAALGAVPVRISLRDPLLSAVLAQVELIADLAAGAAAGSVDFATAGLPLGVVVAVLEVQAETGAWQTLAVADFALVDRTPPALAVVAPAAGAFLAVAEPRAEVQAADALSGVASVEVRLDGGAWRAATPATGVLFHLQLEELSEGLHLLEARATDASDNSGGSPGISFTVDLTPPRITITGVADGEVAFGEVVPGIAIEEEHPASESIELDGEPFLSGTPIAGIGEHLLEVTAEDLAGNLAQAAVAFEIAVPEPDLAATKVAELAEDVDGDGMPSPGDVLRYLIAVENRGAAAATVVELADPVPAHTRVVAGSVTASAGTVIGEDPVTVELAEIAAGVTVEVSFEVEIDDPLPGRVSEVSNQGGVASAELPVVLTDDPSVGGASDPTVTAVLAEPLLVVEKTVSIAGSDAVTAAPGDTLEYRLTVRNLGNVAATAIELTDPIPAHATALAGSVDASAGEVISEDPVTVGLAELAVGAELAVVFEVRVDDLLPAAVSEISNQATVASAELTDRVSDDPATPDAGDATVIAVADVGQISIADVTVLESAGGAELTVSLAAPVGREVTVDYATAGGSAAAGADFEAVAGTVTMVPGQTVATVTVPLVDDMVHELEETFAVILDRPVAGELADGEATVTVADDDPVPSLSIAGASVVEGDAGTAATLNLAVTLSNPTVLPVTADFAAAGETATAGADFEAAAGSVAFGPLETAGVVAVTILGDGLDEADETLRVALSGAVNASLGVAAASVTILDDDPLPALSVAGVTVVEGGTRTAVATFAVSLSMPSGRDVQVSYATADGDAVAGEDYLETSGTLHFAAGDTEREVAVTVIDDEQLESDESFLLELTSPVDAALGVSSASALIVDDDEMLGWRLFKTAAWPGDAAVPGDEVSYEIEVVNSGNLALTEVVVRDPLPPETALLADSIELDQGEIESLDPLVVRLGELAPEVTAGIRFTVEIDAPLPPDVVSISNQATAESVELALALSDDPSTAEPDDPTLTPVAVPLPVLSVADVEVGEGAAAAVFVLRLDAPAAVPVSVRATTADGTATAGEDYQPLDEEVVVPAGEVEREVAVILIDDEQLEPDETFLLELTDPVDAALGVSSASALIVDDDEMLGWRLFKTASWPGDAAVPGGEVSYEIEVVNSGNLALTEVVVRDPLPPETALLADSIELDQGEVESLDPLVVRLGELAPEVTAGIRFIVEVAAPLPPDVVSISNQATAESVELGLALSDDPSTAEPDDPTVAPVAVPLPVLSVADVEVGEDAAAAIFVLRLDAPAAVPVSVRATTADGTATAGEDYQPLDLVVVLPVGEVEREVPVTLIDDEAVEGDETFELRLTDPVDVDLATLAAAATVIDDDPRFDAVLLKADRVLGEAVAAVPGGRIEYTITLINAGTRPLSGLAVTDQLPADVDLVPGSVTASSGVVIEGDPLEWLLEELPSDAEASLILAVDIDSAIEPGTERIENQARLASAEIPELWSDDPDTTEVGDPTVTLLAEWPIVDIPAVTPLGLALMILLLGAAGVRLAGRKTRGSR